ncbi:MAG: site-specific integrase [Saprospiraceae bacterium]|jgi:integrase|nr:site-specific integrase [Saprospiraceae bacterium]
MISVKIILDTRSKKKDHTNPLKLRIVHNRQTYHLTLGYSVLEKDWDKTGQKVKSSCKTIGNTTRFNALIHKEKQKALDVFTKLQSEGQLETLSFKEIKKRIANKHTDLMTLEFGKEIIAQLRQAQKHGNARVYETMIRSISTFVKDKDFPIKQITYGWLEKYENWYLAKGNSVNGLAVNLRTLRALFNKGIKLKRVSQEYYPFNEYTIKKEGTRKRAISREDIERIKNFEPKTNRQKRAKDYFFISFYLMGASFIDIAFLKISNIYQNRIEYKRRKTGRLHSIPLSLPLKSLLEKYMKGKEKEDFILNVIKSSDPEKQMVNVRDELRRYNRTLKEIGEICKLETPLTSYVSRHSYATIAKYKGVPTAIISEALGHTSEEVTQIYLDSFDKEVLDKYHSMIIE